MKKIFFGGPSITNAEINIVKDSVKNGFYEGMSIYLEKLIRQLNKTLKSKYILPTFTCTHSMHLALLSCGIKKGDEVILPEISWVATAQSIAYTGAKCIFVDIDPTNLCIDPKKIEDSVTSKTKAIMVVHAFGHPCNMKEIKKISKKYGLYLIEDAAPSLGSNINGKMTGTFGDVGCFSFQGSKIATGNEGGVLVTKSKEKYDFAKLYSILGRTDSKKPFWSDHIAYRYGMSNLNAALAYVQVKRIKELVKIKRKIAETYIRYLKNLNNVKFIYEPKYGYSNYAYPNITLENSNKEKRDILIRKLSSKKIYCRAMFPATSEMPMFKTQSKNINSFYVSDNSITLPSPPNLKIKDIKRICDEIKKYVD